jgi:hypothetical protein
VSSIPGRSIQVHLHNTSAVAALNAKLTLLYTMSNGEESEVLPAFYSDNYLSLLPNEQRNVTVDLPAADGKRPIRVKLRGWNVTPASVDVGRTEK